MATMTSQRSSQLANYPSRNAVPVQQLDAGQAALIAGHFKALGDEDLRLRFGMPMHPEQIDRYVDSIHFERDTVFGVFAEDLTLVAVAHLACWPGAGELGLSVLPGHRGGGIGTALFERAVMRARNLRIVELFMHCLAQNDAILHIARKAGMRVVHDHAEVDAFLELEPGNPLTLGQEAMAQQYALFEWARRACQVWPRVAFRPAV